MTIDLLIQLLLIVVSLILILVTIKTKNSKKEQLLTLYIIVLAIILVFYFYKIGEYPLGMNGDEAAVMYDGINIARYGCDRYLNKFPIYFTNSGDGQSPLFTYIFACLFKLANLFKGIDMSTLSVDKALVMLRMPTLIYNLLSYFVCFYIIKKEYGNKIAVVSLLALLPLPICFMHSRWSLDCYYLFPNLMLASVLFLKAINSNNNVIYFLSGVLFGLCLYSYAIAYIIVPIMLVLLLMFSVIGRKFTLKGCLCFTIPILLMAIPLIMFVCVNYFDLDEFTFLGFTITKLPRFRAGEISLKNIVLNLQNLGIFKTILYDGLDYNSNKVYTTIFYFNIPVMVLGLIVSLKKVIKSLKKREFIIDYIGMSLLISTGFVALITSPINVNVINAIYIPMIFYLATGYLYIFNKNKYCYRTMITILIMCFLLFVNQYFSSQIYGSFISSDFLKQVQKIKELDKNNGRLCFYKITKNVPIMNTYISIFSDDNLFEKKRYESFIETEQEFPIDMKEDNFYLLDEDNNEVNKLRLLGYKTYKVGKLVLLYK